MSHPDDELLSALLDGEAPPGDAAHVDGCDACQARLAELRGASVLVASPVGPPPGHVREAQLASAVRILDDPGRVSAAPRRMNGLSAAAVLVVALAVGGLLITQLGRSNNTTRTSDTASLAQGLASTTVAAARSGKAAAASDAAGTLAAPSSELATANGGGTTATAYDAGELGALSTIDEVIKRASADLNESNADQLDHAMPESAPCPVEVAGTTLWHATLTFDGEAAVAQAIETDAGRVMRILRRADCSLLASQDF